MSSNKPPAPFDMDELLRLFLANELPLEEAAREIVQRLPRGEGWNIAFTKDAPAKDVARIQRLYWRVSRLLEETLDDNAK